MGVHDGDKASENRMATDAGSSRCGNKSSGSSVDFVYISDDQVQSLLDVGELLQALERSLGRFSKGKDGGVVQPVRSVVKVEKSGNAEDDAYPDGFFGVMPVYSAYDGILACKLVTFYPGNSRCGKHTHMAKVTLYDVTTGELKCMMDGDYITALRTAAASALASKHVYSGGVDKPIALAILGAGVQARSHIKALSHVFNIKQLKVWSRTFESASKLCSEVHIDAKPCESVEDAVRDADIIVTATFSSTPVLRQEWLKEGVHINAVGACRHDWQELEPELVRNSVVYVDSRDAAMKEAGDIILAKAEIYAEIGEVINGSKERKTQPFTVFKSLGMGLEDAVSAKLVYDTHKKQ